MPNISNPIQRFFWENLTRGGLDLVDAGRVEQLIDYAKKNQITTSTATPVAAGGTHEVDTFETSALKGLLDANEWRGLLTDDGVRRLEQALNITAGTTTHVYGKDALGSVPQGTIRGNLSTMIGTRGLKLEHTAELFKHEYAQRKAQLFENPRISEEERGKQVLFLLQDYAKVLKAAGGGPELTNERQELLKNFFESPVAKVYGSKDPDDDLLCTAWEIVWGTDPEKAEKGFKVDTSKSWSAYMSMNGEFKETAAKIDAYLVAKGEVPKVAAFESKSPLNWIVGEETGNTKPAYTFSESSAIKSTGVDFAAKLLDDESKLGKRVLDPSFDLKVDFFAWGNFVTLNKRAGEKLLPQRDSDKAPLTVEIENVGDAHWKPVFKDASGAVVPAEQVTAVILDARGKVKGDGAATGSYSASWWGFCDRNAMQGLVTMKYGFPKPEKDVTLKVGDKSFTFTKEDITLMVGRRLTEVFPVTTQAGNRYDDEPDQVHLNDGTTLHGKIGDAVNFYQPDTHRIGDNMVLTAQSAGAPQGSLLVGDRDVDAAQIDELMRLPPDPGSRDVQVSIKLKDGTEVTGPLKSKFSWDGAARGADGSMTIKASADVLIRGDLKMTDVRGEAKRVPLGDVSYFVREDQNEILAEEALAYIIRNQGIFCADSWTGSSVANGTRTIDSINRWAAGDANLPDWVPSADERKTLEGVRGKVKNPDNLYFFQLGNSGSSYGGLKFWLEFDENKNVINSKITDGQWDFLWGVEGKPNWDARATFNKHVPNDLVLQLYVNSLNDPNLANDVLPGNWRDQVLPATPTT